MRYKLRLDARINQKRKNGYPVSVFLSDKGGVKKVNLGLFFEKKEWNFKTQMPKTDKKLFIIILKKRQILENILIDIVSGEKYNLERVKNILLNEVETINTNSFFEFYLQFNAEKHKAGKIATAKSYENAYNILKVFRDDVLFDEINYNLLNDFKNWRVQIGNSKSTVHTYLRKYRAVYNEACRRNFTTDSKPFEGVFKNITVKANRTKKRNLTKEAIKKLEGVSGLTMYHQRAVDLFLLMFYFGGQDLKDIYYLEHQQINKNRVYFMRGKLSGNGYQFDLQITDKAQKIINKYQVTGKFVFPWRKDFDGYKSFRDNLRRSLDLVQTLTAIEVQPLGGKIRIKVARHTFANIGKQLYLDTDLLRELMGHERNDVDTIYKDRFPEAVRDEAHLKIIQ